MIDFLTRLAINAVALVAAVTFVPRVRFDYGQDWWKLVAVAALFGVINAYIRPIVAALSLPFNLVALGMVGLAVNTAMLLLLTLVSAQLRLGLTLARWPEADFRLDVVLTALIAGIVIAAVSTALGLMRRLVPA